MSYKQTKSLERNMETENILSLIDRCREILESKGEVMVVMEK